MKKFLKELFIFCFGFAIGFGEILYLYSKGDEYQLDSYIVAFFEGIKNRLGNDFIQLLPWWAFALVAIILLLIIGLIVTQFFRIFVNSKNLNVISSFVYILITFIVAIPFARFVMIFLDMLLVSADFVVFAVLRGIVFSILLRLQIFLFGFSYYTLLKKPKRNCVVALCEVTSENGYDLKTILAKKMTFDQCFTFIRSYVFDIEKRQFFQIIEKGLFGKKINSWNYYRGGNPMNCTEEAFLSGLFHSNVHRGIKLKTEEEKNERD